MFGNPNISITPADDNLTRSQADLYGNSFASPLNPANMNQGFGINPALLTPSYTAGYRPAYQGPHPAGNFGRPGFFAGLNGLNPLMPDVPWGNPFMHQQPNIEAVTERPADAGMWGVQRIAAPALAFGAASAMMGGFHGGWNMWKGSRAGYAMGSSLGRGIGSGLASSFGIRGALATGMGATTGIAGGMAVGFGAPLAIGSALMWGAEKMLFNPYQNTRRSAQDFRSNFAGVTFAENVGNPIHGGGIGGAASYGMASQITSQGINDMTFSASEYGSGASMIARAGLMDNVGAKGLTRRVKESMDQVKLIMSIASMPEMREAIEQLAKLQQAGASVSGGGFSSAAGTMARIGSLASVAGTSVQRLMNTVGAQGQYLYQANGMTPFLGQLAAANSFASLSAGNRMGLFGSAQLARMGGLDGATQASLTGQINVSQTLYNKMSNYNTLLGSGRQGSMVGNITTFGQGMSKDPMGVYGGMLIHGRQMAGVQMEARGSLAVEDQLMSMAANMPWLLGKDGKISLERAVPLLLQMGMNEDQIHAFAAERIADQDAGAYGLKMKGMDRNLAEQSRQYVSAHGTYGGPIGGSIYAARKYGRKLTAGVADGVVRPITGAIGSAQDAISEMVDGMWFGTTIKNSGDSIDDLLGTNTLKNPDGTYQGFEDTKAGRSQFLPVPLIAKMFGVKGGKFGDLDAMNDFISGSKVADQMNDLAAKGNKHAVAYFKASSPEEKRKHLTAALGSGALGEENKQKYGRPDAMAGLENVLNGMTVGTKQARGGGEMPEVDAMGNPTGRMISADGEPVDKVAGFRSELASVSGLKNDDMFESLQSVGVSFNIAAKMQRGDITNYDVDEKMETDEDLKRLSKLTGKTGQELLRHAESSAIGGIEKGLIRSGTIAAGMDRTKYGSSEEALRAVDKITPIHSNALLNAKDIDKDEAMGFAMASQLDAKQRQSITEKYKSGRIDFSGYQSTVNQLDNKKAIDKFDKAVDRFANAVDGKKPTGAGEESVMTRVERFFGGKKKEIEKP